MTYHSDAELVPPLIIAVVSAVHEANERPSLVQDCVRLASATLFGGGTLVHALAPPRSALNCLTCLFAGWCFLNLLLLGFLLLSGL